MDRKNVENLLPLAPGQRGILFHALYEPAARVYVNQLALTIDAALEQAPFERAWHQTIERHAALRASFHWDDLKAPLQVIQRQVTLPIRWDDERALPAAEQQRREESFLEEDRALGFDVATAPLLRLRVTRTGEARTRLLFSYHHLLLDAWSFGLVLREALALYEGEVAGKPAALPRPPAYAAFLRWLQEQREEATEPFWRAHLRGITRPTPLPGDLAPRRLPAPGDRQDEVRLRLSPEQSAALRAFAQQQRVTPGALLHAAWALLLARCTGEPDVVIGSVVSGRSAPVEGIDAMVGLFINTLPLRLHVDPRATALAFAQEVQRAQRELLTREHASLSQVQAWSVGPRGTPLFESIVVFENVRPDEALRRWAAPEALRVRQLEHSSYPLTLVIHDEPALELLLAHDPHRFDAATATRMLGHLATLVSGMVARPQTRLAELPLLTAGERAILLDAWNDTRVPRAPGQTVHALFEAQVDRTPDAPAVAFDGATLGYRALDEAANRLAHALRRLGIGPERKVAVCVEPSLEGIVALYGVLKAGGAYVPLAPDSPRERLALTLRAAGATVLLTQSRLRDALPSDGLTVLALDDAAAFAGESIQRPAAQVAPENLAYVVFTSGSTGVPKGVEVTHRSVVNHNLAVAERFQLRPSDRVLQFTPLNFDAAVEEIFPPLLAGARIVVRGELVPVLEFSALIAREGLTLLSLPPAFMHEWVSELSRRGERLPPGLRLVLLGGEKILPESLALWQAVGGRDVPWINVYGPTEATVTSALCELGAGGVALDQPVLPIGRPISNGRIYLVDPHLQPVPVGVPGELLIGGAGLARGYLGAPDQTAERFAPDPFSPEPGARLYRTGDLARYLPDGRIEFLGRVDTQLKIRGNRVEPAEVEAALRKHAPLQDAVAVAHEVAPGDTRLIAYVVASGSPAPSASSLRAALQERLPDYMVPAAFVFLAALPLTPNGKVDRKALPAPELGAGERPERIAPRGPAEEAVARAFAEVLRVADVGALDDFFALGGHSLLATQVVSRLRAAFPGREVPLRLLFEAPRVDALAARLEAPAAPALAPVTEVAGPAPLSFAQERLWFIHQLEPKSSAYNIPLELRLDGPLDAAALGRTLNALLTRHPVLRTTFRREKGQALQVVQPEATLALPLIDLSTLPEAEREPALRAHAAEEMARPFDLERGPLLRAVLLRRAADAHTLLLTAHHIAVDGWSLAVLGRELAALYPALRAGRPSPLPALPLSYVDFARGQRQRLQGDALEGHLAYWRQRLQGATPLQLPTDRPPPPAPSYRRGMKVFTLEPALATDLRALAQRHGASFFMVLLAGYQAVLARYTGQDDLLVGTDTANRTPETEGLVGYFVNQLPLRTDASGDPSFAALLGRVRDTTLGAFAHEELPFEELVKVWNPERSAYHHGPLQVKLSYQRFDAPARSTVDGLEIEVDELHSETTPFQFSVVVDDLADGVRVTVNYQADLFDPASAERFAGHLTTLLQAATRAPETRLSALPLLTTSERHQLLVEWNATRAPLPADRCVPDLFEAQAERTPDAIAVVFGDARLTYRELEVRANQLARALQARGVGPEVRVGVVLEPSADVVVALLGVLKAGGAYVPLAPDAPADRIAYALRDARAKAVLTQSALLDRLPAGGPEALALDAEAVKAALAREPETRPARAIGPDNLAYVVYTSGSTGEPKGVLLAHRGVVNHNLAVARRFGLGPSDRMLQFTPISFDAAVEEIFPPLATGATVVVRGELVPTSQFGPLVEREGLTVLSLPPAWLHEWVSELSRRAAPLPRGLRLVLLGGEKILPESVALWRKLGGEAVPWINVYGPTEATVTSALCELGSGGVPLDAPVLPIGGPIANARIHLLDARGAPVPVNVPGELFIGGPGLARGYLGRPDQTAERFVPDPFSAEPGARLYRTGDLARYNGRGQLEFIGRADSQVKLRGFRIELGEVEAALRKHPGLRDAVVALREDTPGEKRLVAYVVSAEGPAPRGAELRALLFKSLPDYMVPAAFVPLDALPLTPNGKVDRKALPVPPAGTEPQWEQVGPRTPVEAQLTAIFEEVLEVTSVGVTDDFFSLGGHSLSAVRLLERITEATGGLVEFADLFEQPTVEHLAEVVERSRTEAPAVASLRVSLQPRGEKPPLFLAPAAGGRALGYFALARRLGEAQPIYALQSPGLDTDEAPLATIEALAARYVAELRQVQPQGPYRLGGYSMGGTVAFEMARQLTAAGEQVSLLALLDTYGPALERRLGVGNLPPAGADDGDEGLRLLGGQYGLDPAALAAMPAAERWPHAQQLLAAAGVIPPGLALEALQRLARVYVANARAHSEYTGGPYAGPITLLRADASARHGDPALGWAELAPGRVEIVPVPGDHQGMLAGGQLEAVAQQLRARLERG